MYRIYQHLAPNSREKQEWFSSWVIKDDSLWWQMQPISCCYTQGTPVILSWFS